MAVEDLKMTQIMSLCPYLVVEMGNTIEVIGVQWYVLSFGVGRPDARPHNRRL